MKYLVQVIFIGILLSGCADTPSKQATIEDRAVATTASSTAEVKPSVETLGTAEANVTSRNLVEQAGSVKQADAVKERETVETRGVVDQNPEAKALGKVTEQNGVVGKQADSTGSADKSASNVDQADSLKYVPQPILDPHNAQSPLAQRRLLFDFDSAVIRDEYRTLLELHAQYLKNEKTAKLILQGHADERGSREYNLALGQRRAESVYKALNLLAVPEAQMEAVSLGEEKPIVEGHDENAWAQNRRTELFYQGD